MIWPFRTQADYAEQIRAELAGLLTHITDEIAVADAVEALARLRHMRKVLAADAEREEVEAWPPTR